MGARDPRSRARPGATRGRDGSPGPRALLCRGVLDVEATRHVRASSLRLARTGRRVRGRRSRGDYTTPTARTVTVCWFARTATRPGLEGSCSLVTTFGVAGESVVWDGLPRCAVVHELPRARADSGVTVEGAHANADRIGVAWVVSVDRRAARHRRRESRHANGPAPRRSETRRPRGGRWPTLPHRRAADIACNGNSSPRRAVRLPRSGPPRSCSHR